MQLEIKEIDHILFIKPLEKSIETFNSREFKTQIFDLIHQQHDLIILNLSNVEFIDSNGLGCLVSILKLLTSHQGRILACNAQDPVKRIFNLTRLNQVLPLFQNEEEATTFLQDTMKTISKEQ